MSDATPIPAGVNLNAHGDVNIGGDAVGRDKFIKNIVIVGEVLKLAQVESLLPSLGKMPELASVEAALKQALGGGADNVALGKGIAFAAEVVLPVLEELRAERPVDLRKHLHWLVESVFEAIKRANYWDAYSSWIAFDGAPDVATALELTALNKLWLNNERQPSFIAKRYYLCEEKDGKGWLYINTGPRIGFVVKQATNEEIRICWVGLMLDLIRIEMQAHGDAAMVDGLIGFLGAGNK